jgi:UDP-GlcNAc:undecaprenyl-phosphate/decaprenyl-phosphate GlcNAc-1-phosphate transferase
MPSGAISFIAALILFPVVANMCVRWSLYDSPGPLKIHAQPIPRLGGVAIVLALTAGALAVSYSLQTPAWCFWIALALIWTAGFLDDIRGLSPILRLGAQIGAGALLWNGGWRLPFVGNGIVGLIAVCLFAILFANAFNFLDGSDGLCAGVAGIIAFAYVALPGAALSPLGIAVAWSVLGATSAFLFANSPPRDYLHGGFGEHGSRIHRRIPIARFLSRKCDASRSIRNLFSDPAGLTSAS